MQFKSIDAATLFRTKKLEYQLNFSPHIFLAWSQFLLVSVILDKLYGLLREKYLQQYTQ